MLGAILATVLPILLYLPRLPLELTATTSMVDLVASAMDCASGRGCETRLTPSAPHGAGITHFLAAVLFLGGEIKHGILAIGVLTGLCFGLLFVVIARTYGEVTAHLMMLIALSSQALKHLPGGGLDSFLGPEHGAELVNQALLPPFSLLFITAASCFLVSKRLPYIAIAAFGAAMSLNFHLTAISLLPALVVLVALSPRSARPKAILTAIIAVLLTAQLSYPAIWLDGELGPDLLQAFQSSVVPATTDLDVSIGVRFWVGLLIGVASLAGLRATTTKPKQHLFLFLLVTHLPFFLFLGVVASSDCRYFHSLGPGMTLLAALTITRLLRSILSSRDFLSSRGRTIGITFSIGIGALVPSLGLIGSTVSDPSRFRPPEVLTFKDLEVISEHLKTDKLRLPELAGRLHGNEHLDRRSIKRGLALHAPAWASKADSESTEEHLELLLLPPESVPELLPPGWTSIRQRQGYTLILRRFIPLLQWHDTLTCKFLPLEPEASCICQGIVWKAEHFSHARDQKRLSSKIRVRIRNLGFRPGAPAYSIVRVPIRVTESTAGRDLILPKVTPSYPCEGAILSVEDLELETIAQPSSSIDGLPATHMRVPENTSGRGYVTVAWDLSSTSCRSANTPLSLPTVLERDPNVPLPTVIEPSPAFTDSDMLERLIECIQHGEPDTRGFETHHSPPSEPLLPGWYVFFLFCSFGPAFLAAFVFCLGAPTSISKLPSSFSAGKEHI